MKIIGYPAEVIWKMTGLHCFCKTSHIQLSWLNFQIITLIIAYPSYSEQGHTADSDLCVGVSLTPVDTPTLQDSFYDDVQQFTAVRYLNLTLFLS